ncbi:MAG: DPP IV N-terminal domain-containing protein [Pseudomonadota bacterium]
MGGDVSAVALPIDTLSVMADGGYSVHVGKKAYLCGGEPFQCEEKPGLDPALAAAFAATPPNISPNNAYGVISQDHNLALFDLRSGEQRPVTTDGVKHWGYGGLPESNRRELAIRRAGVNLPPSAIWSPDGLKFVSYRLDERDVPDLHIVQSAPDDGSYRPKLHTYRMPLLGDPSPTAQYFIHDVQTNTSIGIDYRALPVFSAAPSQLGHIWWSPNGDKIFMFDFDIDTMSLALVEISPSTGAARVVIKEDVSGHVGPGPRFTDLHNVRVLTNGDIIWYSERTGWGHLYRYNSDGVLQNAITSGDWLVRELLRIDEGKGFLYFTASGFDEENIYHRKVFRASLDGETMEHIGDERGDHKITVKSPAFFELERFFMDGGKTDAQYAFSPNGEFFVDLYGAVDDPGTWVLKTSAGTVISELAVIDPSPLPPLTLPEQFSVQSGDGEWTLYGVIFKPANFDPTQSYPVIDHIYPGPQTIKSPHAFAWDSGSDTSAVFGRSQALADLGFVVVTLEGRGTPMRSKAFRELSYGEMDRAGYLEDHVSGIRQLAEARAYMDLSRVGIFGNSGGGFATAKALIEYPDFYKVGVSSAGNHEQRSYINVWGQLYHGPLEITDYDKIFAGKDVSRFKGKLLLAHGELDGNVHPANTMRLAKALIDAGKRFDMLIMPNVHHNMADNMYFQRLTEIYFIEHLMGGVLESPDAVQPVGIQSN